MRKHLKKITSFVLTLSLLLGAAAYAGPAMAADSVDPRANHTRNGSNR